MNESEYNAILADKELFEKRWNDAETENGKLRAEVERLNKSAQGYYDEAAKGWSKFRAAEVQIDELREALYALLRHAGKPQPRDEEEQEQVIAKVAKALKSAGKLDDSEEISERQGD